MDTVTHSTQLDAPIFLSLRKVKPFGKRKRFLTAFANVGLIVIDACWRDVKVEQGKIKAGDNLLLAAFGAGLTWGAGHIKWGQRVTPLEQSALALPECQQSALELLESAIEHCKNKPV